MSTDNVKLTAAQRHLLEEYLNEKRQMITTIEGLTTTTVIDWVREALKFTVTTGMITRLVGPDGKLFSHEWPGSAQSRKGRLTAKIFTNLVVQQLALVTKELQTLKSKHNGLAHSLGEAVAIVTSRPIEIPGFGDVVLQAGEDLADSDLRSDEERADSKVDNTFRPGVDPDPNPVLVV